MKWIVKKEILKMAKEGAPFAQMNVGLYYFEKGNDKQGYRWLRKSAEQGNSAAQCALGICCYQRYNMGVRFGSS